MGPIDNPANSQYSAGSFHRLDFQMINTPNIRAKMIPTPRSMNDQKVSISVLPANEPDPLSYVILFDSPCLVHKLVVKNILIICRTGHPAW